MIAGVLAVFRRITRVDAEGSPSRPIYLIAVVTAAVLGVAARLFIANPLFVDAPSLAAIIPTSARMVVVITIVQTVSGMLTLRYSRMAGIAQARAEKIGRQQEIVVEAQERAQREVADFLHDRVQADLLVVAFEVRHAASDADETTCLKLTEIVKSLERIRTDDVRGAGRRLSPDIASLGIDTALDELGESWRSAMSVTFHWRAHTRDTLVGTEVSADLLRAVYRIVEQALLNAVAHGHASEASVHLQLEGDHLLLKMIDNGTGFGATVPGDGAGQAIIDAWASIVGGAWSWSNGDSGGVVVQARLPLQRREKPVPNPSESSIQ